MYQVVAKIRLTRSRNVSWGISVFLTNWLPLLHNSWLCYIDCNNCEAAFFTVSTPNQMRTVLLYCFWLWTDYFLACHSWAKKLNVSNVPMPLTLKDFLAWCKSIFIGKHTFTFSKSKFLKVTLYWLWSPLFCVLLYVIISSESISIIPVS